MGLCISDPRPGDELNPRAPAFEPDDALDSAWTAILEAQGYLTRAKIELSLRGLNSTAAGLIEEAVAILGGTVRGAK